MQKYMLNTEMFINGFIMKSLKLPYIMMNSDPATKHKYICHKTYVNFLPELEILTFLQF